MANTFLDELFGNEPEPVRLWRVRMRSGMEHIGAHPRIGGGKWVRRDHPELLRRMGELGYSCIEEIPLMNDYSVGVLCEHCNREVGAENHHWAPREVFGDECEDWPQANLCKLCHDEWHRRIKVFYGRATLR